MKLWWQIFRVMNCHKTASQAFSDGKHYRLNLVIKLSGVILVMFVLKICLSVSVLERRHDTSRLVLVL